MPAHEDWIGEHLIGTPGFDGETIDPPKDQKRLERQLAAVRELMMDGEEHDPAELAAILEAHNVKNVDAAVRARTRDFRKPKFGAFNIIRRRVAGADGHHLYRLLRAVIYVNPSGKIVKVKGSNDSNIPFDIVVLGSASRTD